MKTKFLIFTFLLCVFLNMQNMYSQKTITILLNKKACPFGRYNQTTQDGPFGKFDSIQKAALCAPYTAGDYSDSVSKFRLVIWPPLYGSNLYRLFITPYGCDSVYIGAPSISNTDLPDLSTIIGIGKRKFKVILFPLDDKIELTDISNMNVDADIRLFENKLPNIQFPLISGGTKLLSSFEHQHKLIYIHFWDAIDYKLNINDFDTLKQVYDADKNNVNIISLFYSNGCTMAKFDTNSVKTAIAEKQPEWTQGYCSLRLAGELFINGCESGMLFDEDGNVIKMFILPGELSAYLKKKYRE